MKTTDDWIRRDHIDERSAKYLTACFEQIGYLGSVMTERITVEGALQEEGRPYEVVDSMVIKKTVSQGEITGDVLQYTSRDGKTVYAVSWGQRAGIDAAVFFGYHFDQKPSKEDLLTARAAEDVTRKIMDNAGPEFRCWECGCTVHWLDSENTDMGNDLPERLRRFEDRYCGC